MERNILKEELSLSFSDQYLIPYRGLILISEILFQSNLSIKVKIPVLPLRQTKLGSSLLEKSQIITFRLKTTRPTNMLWGNFGIVLRSVYLTEFSYGSLMQVSIIK